MYTFALAKELKSIDSKNPASSMTLVHDDNGKLETWDKASKALAAAAERIVTHKRNYLVVRLKVADLAGAERTVTVQLPPSEAQIKAAAREMILAKLA
jgi:hypothetical protein